MRPLMPELASQSRWMAWMGCLMIRPRSSDALCRMLARFFSLVLAENGQGSPQDKAFIGSPIEDSLSFQLPLLGVFRGCLFSRLNRDSGGLIR